MSKPSVINVPNALSLIRLLGVPLLFYLIHLDSVLWFISWFIFLGLTDYFDGLLARRWNQATAFGSHLDAIADVAYYLSAAWFFFVLFPDYLVPNLPYVYAMLVMFGLSLVIARAKTGRFKFLHTHLSRLCGVLVFFGFLLSFTMDTSYLLRGIILIYALAFVEISFMFWLYGDVNSDTRTILHLKRK
ncbi:MAG: CDP-alcohol phosphatidyltransferase family protein [Balneolaceae bacterium]|nr:MAG: CDP-alcohol phosphatidyltransferase family protein [Balneolaceae bacterium]